MVAAAPPFRVALIGGVFLLLAWMAHAAAPLAVAPAEPLRPARPLPVIMVPPPVPPPPFDRKACEAAIQRGDPGAPVRLGHFLLLTDESPSGKVAARHWFQVGADRGDPEAAYRLSVCQIFGVGGEGELRDGLRRLEQVASSGHAAAQVLMGDMLTRDFLTLSMVRRARDWYRRAAAQGNPVAMLSLAQSMMSGRGGLTPMFDLALVHVEEAARLGWPDAWYWLGLFYDKGWGGLTPDQAVARHCYRIGAELGSGRAWGALAGLLEETGAAAVDRTAVIFAYEQAARCLSRRSIQQAPLIREAWRRAVWWRQQAGQPVRWPPLPPPDLPDQLLEPIPPLASPSSR